MWVITQHGFYSIVEHRDNPDLLLARGRVKADVQRLADFANVPLMETPLADYPWRVIVPRSVIEAFLADEVKQISYDNFKAHVDPERAHVYGPVWRQLQKLEQIR